jgi:hypothetical protein
MSVKRIVKSMVAGCAVILVSATTGLAAQTPQEHQHAATDQVKPASGMEAKCQAMMAERDKMMTAMKAADQRLDDLVARMNTAAGTEKMAATASVVTGDRAPDDAGGHDENAGRHDEPHDGAHAGRDGLDGHVPDDEADGRHEKRVVT